MGYFDADAEDMLEVYLLETRQLTGQLSAVLLDTEKKNAFSGEDIHSIFRIMHTIKSSSAMMGLQELSSMAHKLEDLFAYYRENFGKIEKPEPELFDLLFAASDYIETELGDMENEDYDQGSRCSGRYPHRRDGRCAPPAARRRGKPGIYLLRHRPIQAHRFAGTSSESILRKAKKHCHIALRGE